MNKRNYVYRFTKSENKKKFGIKRIIKSDVIGTESKCKI